MFGPKLVEAFREFKRIWDPQGKMNPGKVVDAYAITENLRLGTDLPSPAIQTHFRYRRTAEASPSAPALRGCGQVPRTSGGTMCPSFFVTREEEHSTRGRAHLLSEMLRGEVIEDGWRSREVRDALDLMPRLQGLQDRLSRRSGHGHLLRPSSSPTTTRGDCGAVGYAFG